MGNLSVETDFDGEKDTFGEIEPEFRLNSNSPSKIIQYRTEIEDINKNKFSESISLSIVEEADTTTDIQRSE